SMIPDIDVLSNITTNQSPDWIVLTFRGIGEMQDQQSLNPDPARSWVDLSNETDGWQMRRTYVNLVATKADRDLWSAVDQATFALAAQLAQAPANIQYLNAAGQFQAAQPQPDAQGRGFWQDLLGTTHHEAGT